MEGGGAHYICKYVMFLLMLVTLIKVFECCMAFKPRTTGVYNALSISLGINLSHFFLFLVAEREASSLGVESEGDSVEGLVAF
jgi:hypothetical protein